MSVDSGETLCTGCPEGFQKDCVQSGEARFVYERKEPFVCGYC